MSPRVGRKTPVTTLKTVVLPAPFGPMRAAISPSATWIDTFDSAATPPKCIVTSSRTRRGSGPRSDNIFGYLTDLARREMAELAAKRSHAAEADVFGQL